MSPVLGWLIFAAPDAVKTSASRPCNVDKNAFIVTFYLDDDSQV